MELGISKGRVGTADVADNRINPVGRSRESDHSKVVIASVVARSNQNLSRQDQPLPGAKVKRLVADIFLNCDASLEKRAQTKNEAAPPETVRLNVKGTMESVTFVFQPNVHTPPGLLFVGKSEERSKVVAAGDAVAPSHATKVISNRESWRVLNIGFLDFLPGGTAVLLLQSAGKSQRKVAVS